MRVYNGDFDLINVYNNIQQEEVEKIRTILILRRVGLWETVTVIYGGDDEL